MTLRQSLLLAPALCLGLGSCVRATWTRTQVCQPLEPTAWESMALGETDLAECLRVLGAPLLVWEVSSDSYGLAYGWEDTSGWSVNLSIPLAGKGSGSFDYESQMLNLYGVVLIFDDEDQLVRHQSGYLRDIATGLHRSRPSLPADQLGS